MKPSVLTLFVLLGISQSTITTFAWPSEKEKVQSAARDENMIDLNKATIEQLMSLKGVGKKIAERIIQYREKNLFQTVEEIKKVPGIGEKLFEQIRTRLKV